MPLRTQTAQFETKLQKPIQAQTESQAQRSEAYADTGRHALTQTCAIQNRNVPLEIDAPHSHGRRGERWNPKVKPGDR